MLINIISAGGIIALIFATIWVSQRVVNVRFILALLIFGFFIAMTISPLRIDLEARAHVKAELANRPHSDILALSSLYVPSLDDADRNSVCLGFSARNCDIKLWKLASYSDAFFVETGTDPIYRWEYVIGSARCFDSDLQITFLGHPQLVARGNCFILHEVESSSARYRLEFPQDIGSRVTLIDQEQDKIIDTMLRYNRYRSGYPILLGNKLRQVSSGYGLGLSDYTDGAILDMGVLIKNLETPGYPVNGRFGGRTPEFRGISEWRNDLVALGLSSDEWSIYAEVHKASCQMWNETSLDIRQTLLKMAAENSQLSQHCGETGCYSLSEAGQWSRVDCE